MRDVETREDIVHLLERFYAKAMKDDVIGYFFTEVVPLHLDTHIPKIADFWEAIVFNTQAYSKNVMEVHQHISDKSAIHKEHLDHWVALFTETVEEEFEGARATLMKQRAASIATLMNIKLNHQPFSPG